MAAAKTGEGQLRIRQVRSMIGCSPKQVASLRSVGLGKIGSESVRAASPQLHGQLRVVSHLIETEEVS